MHKLKFVTVKVGIKTRYNAKVLVKCVKLDPVTTGLRGM